jgi:hypothetical protein
MHHYAAIAGMRKTLVILNAMVKANQPWKHPRGLDIERSCSVNPGAVHHAARSSLPVVSDSSMRLSLTEGRGAAILPMGTR